MKTSRLRNIMAVGAMSLASFFPGYLFPGVEIDVPKLEVKQEREVVYDLAGETPTFADCYEVFSNNKAVRLLFSEYNKFLDKLNPETGDINGKGWIDKSSKPDEYEFSGNDIPDTTFELKLIEKVLKDSEFVLSNGLNHDLVMNAWKRNDEQLEKDVGGKYNTLKGTLNGFPQVMNGMMIIGDGDANYSNEDCVDWQGSAGFVKGLMYSLRKNIDNGKINLEDYVRLSEFFSPKADADGDGISNRGEFNAYRGNLEKAVNNALNPLIHPQQEFENIEEEVYEGEIVELPFYNLNLDNNNYLVNEGDVKEIKVTANGPVNEKIIIYYECLPLKGTSKEDYSPESGFLTFNKGDKEKSIYFSAIKDNEIEEDEKVQIRLSVEPNLRDRVAIGIGVSTIIINGTMPDVEGLLDYSGCNGCRSNQSKKFLNYFLN